MATAIYIEYPRITAVEITGSGRKPRIKRVMAGELAEARNEDGTPIADRQAHLNAQIAAFVKEHKIGGGKLYLVIGPDGMRYRDIHLAFSDRRQIERVLRFQVEGVIPSVPIEDLTLGYNVLRSSEGSAQLLVHAAEKDYARARITALEEAGLVVEGADSHLSGTFNLGMQHPELSGDGISTLWLDFAGSSATIAEVEGGVVHTARVFLSPYLAAESHGTRDAARTAQEQAEARAAEFHGEDGAPTLPKAESVNIGEQEVADRIQHMSRDQLQKFLNHIAVEARRTLLMTNLEQEPQRLVISGLGAAGPEIARMVGEELGLEDTVAIELLESVNPPGKDGNPAVELPDLGEISYVCGVALKGLGRDYTLINFRYGDLAAGTLFDYAKTPLAFAATLVLLFAGILFLMSFTHARNYERALEDLRSPSNDRGPRYYFDNAFRHASDADRSGLEYPENPDPAVEIGNAHARLKKHQEVLMGSATDNYPRPLDADEILAATLRAIQQAGPSYDFTLLRLVVANRQLTVEFFASLTEDAAERERMVKAGHLPAEMQGLTEPERMLAALRTLINEHPQWFDALAPVHRPGAESSGNGRSVRRHVMSIQLKTPTAAGGRR